MCVWLAHSIDDWVGVVLSLWLAHSIDGLGRCANSDDCYFRMGAARGAVQLGALGAGIGSR